MKKGDIVATVAQPIAKTIDYWLGTDLKNCGGCQKAQERLNRGDGFVDVFYDRFFKTKQKEET